MACGNCGLLAMWTRISKCQDESLQRAGPQGLSLDEAARIDMVECEKQERLEALSKLSTTADSSDCSSSIDVDSDNDQIGASSVGKRGVKFMGNFPCPHCFQKFETEEALQQHDTCMIMPTVFDETFKSGDGSIETVGVKLDGKIQCPECNQKFDTERALSLHCKFIHVGAVFNEGYTLVYEFDSSRSVDTSRVA
jgi:hypothetical protein